MIAFNCSTSIFSSRHASLKLFSKKIKSIQPVANIGIGIAVISAFSIVSFVVLIRSIGQGFLVFLLNPMARGFLADANIGAGISFAYFALYGIQMMPVASILWLASIGSKHQQPKLGWLTHALISLLILILVSPRTAILSYVLALVLVYHLLIRKIKSNSLLTASFILLFYASFINVLRRVTGGMAFSTLGQALIHLLRSVNFFNLIYTFIFSTNLSDIRTFILVERFFGRTIPLKYGQTLLRLITQWIPRSIWPTKPYDLGIEIARLYNPQSLSGSPAGYFAELFINFHFIGVVLGGFLLGFLLSKIYNAWMINNPSLLSVVAYAILAPRIFVIPSSTIANFIINILILDLWALFAILVANLFSKKRVPQ